MQINQLRPTGRAAAATLVALLACVALSSCPGRLSAQETASPPDASQATREAVEAADAWLELIDGGRYETAWERAGDEFRSVVTVRAWERRISSLRQGIGALRFRSLASTRRTDSLPGGRQGDYLVVAFDSSFGTLTGAVETVLVARQDDGGWEPVGYFVRPAESTLRDPGTSPPTR